MRHFLTAAALTAAIASPAFAELEKGAAAPDFSAQGYLGGEPMSFDMSAALSEGPVVLYFFPAAFTPGCNLEASLFAEAADEFEAEGATLIGVTMGNTDRLAEFSEKHCASEFPVAAVSQDIVDAYEANLREGAEWSARTSYVIAPSGEIIHAYTNMNPNDHVNQTMGALKALNADG